MSLNININDIANVIYIQPEDISVLIFKIPLKPTINLLIHQITILPIKIY